jgi:hypothetical protein
MFGVIICPKCHRARGARVPSKTAICVHCGHSIDVTRARVYFRTESEEELKGAVQRMTERLASNIEDYPAERKRRLKVAQPKKVPKVKVSEEELRVLARHLTQDQGDFDLMDLRDALQLSSEEDAQKVLETMRSHGMIFEHRLDRFKAL